MHLLMYTTELTARITMGMAFITIIRLKYRFSSAVLFQSRTTSKYTRAMMTAAIIKSTALGSFDSEYSVSIQMSAYTRTTSITFWKA